MRQSPKNISLPLKGGGLGWGCCGDVVYQLSHRTPIPAFPLPGGRRKKFAALTRLTVLFAPLTTAWMHDHMDVGGSALSGTDAEEVAPRRERLPRRSQNKPPALPGVS